MLDDRQLVSLARSGGRGAFEALVERYRDAVSAVCYSHLGNFDDVEDAAQETFVQAYLYLHALNDDGKFGPWLRRIASNVSKAMLRGRKPSLALEDVPEPVSQSDDVRRTTVRMVVREALARLSEKTRVTVTLSYIDGYSHQEVGRFLDVPVSTVRSRLRIAKARLREEMISMVSDVLHEDKPDPALSVRVMEQVGKILEARRLGPVRAIARNYDEMTGVLSALEAGASADEAKCILEGLLAEAPVSPDEKALVSELVSSLEPKDVVSGMRARVLVDRARISSTDQSEARALVAEAEALVQRLSSGSAVALLELSLASGYDVLGERDAVRQHYARALHLARRFGNRRAEGMCLQLMAIEHFYRHETGAMLDLLARSVPLLKEAGLYTWAVASRSLLSMYEDAGEETFRQAAFRAADCHVLRATDGGASFDVGLATLGWQPGFGWVHWDEVRVCPFMWSAAGVGEPGGFPYAAAPAGTSWSYDTFSYTDSPQPARVTVTGRNETVETPAGVFAGCLEVEQAAALRDELPDASEPESRLNRITTPTTVRTYAPGVGLVCCRSHGGGGMESLSQLVGYSLAEPSEAYLPLAVGNTWSYAWTGTPEDHVGRECYRVAAQVGDLWYLEHYAFIYKAGP